MRFSSVLVVCVGNICRSPVGERLLAAKLAARGAGDIKVASAGISALVGHAADADASAVAAEKGLSLDGHRAQKFTHDLGVSHALILVMEPGHKRNIISAAPDLAGRVMLFDQWTGAAGIADPYRKSAAFHAEVFTLIDKAATAWAEKLAPVPAAPTAGR
jgi:protein-tyrosine phosphatase